MNTLTKIAEHHDSEEYERPSFFQRHKKKLLATGLAAGLAYRNRRPLRAAVQRFNLDRDFGDSRVDATRSAAKRFGEVRRNEHVRRTGRAAGFADDLLGVNPEPGVRKTVRNYLHKRYRDAKNARKSDWQMKRRNR